MADTIFKLDNIDYSAHVVAENYDINYEPVYQEWVDGGQTKHRDVVGRKIRGTFQMYFKAESSLQTFLSRLMLSQTVNHTYPVHLRVNNDYSGELISTNVFIDFRLVRKRDVAWNDAYDVFEVTIEEP